MNFKKYFGIIKISSRHFIAIILIVVAILASNDFFVYNINIITSEDCRTNKCQVSNYNTTDIKISAEHEYYLNKYADILFEGGYYRLVFDYKAIEKSQLVATALKSRDNGIDVAIIDLEKNNDYMQKEFIFHINAGYSGLLFKKNSTLDDEIVLMKNIHISRLNIESDKESINLRQTRGSFANTAVIDQSQIQDWAERFTGLAKGGNMLGQIFKSNGGHMTGVMLDMDITSNGNADYEKYELILKAVTEKKGKNIVGSNDLAILEFSINDLKRYRQPDGRIRFPISFNLKTGGTYLIGIRNRSGRVNKFNNLVLRGSKNNESYSMGSAAIIKSEEVNNLIGDLYFVVYVADLNNEVLFGSRIEDLGGGSGLYYYRNSNSIEDFLNLYLYTKDINFDYGKGVVFGLGHSKSKFIYKVNTIYPFRWLHFFASDEGFSRKKTKIEYSYDMENWIELPFFDNGDSMVIDHIIDGNGGSVVYLKTGYNYKKGKKVKDKYGLNELEINGELSVQ